MDKAKLEELRDWIEPLTGHPTNVGTIHQSEAKIIVALIDAEVARQTNINLCDACQWGCMGACPMNHGIEFGCGVGNDNVIVCHNYLNQIAYGKYIAQLPSTDSTRASEDVDKAIEDLQCGYDHAKWIDSDYIETPMLAKSVFTVIAALRQMKGEPK